MPYQLKVVSGPDSGRSVPVDPSFPTVIGRDPSAQLGVPSDHTLSRQHAQIAFEGGRWVLRNLSQHGTLLAGEVFRDERPIAPGTQFTAGATTFMFEEVAAGAAPFGAPAGGGMAPAGGMAPMGAPAGAGDGGGGAPGAFGGGALAAGAGAAMAGLPSGPVSLPPNTPGAYPFGDLIKGGIAIARANLMPSLVAFSLPVLMIVLNILVNVLAQVIGSVAAILGLVMLILFPIVMLAMPLMVANYMAGVKQYQETGQTFGIGALFNFQDIVPRYLTMFLVGITGICCGIPPIFLSFALPIVIDNPSVGPVNAIKGVIPWVKKNLVAQLLVSIVLGVVAGLGGILCGVGLAFTYPAMCAAFYLAYSLKRDEIRAAAAAEGIQL